MKLINQTIKIATQITASKILQTSYHYHRSKNLIDLNRSQLKKSFGSFRFVSTSTIISLEDSVNNVKTNENLGLATTNLEELLWRVRLGCLTGQDHETFWSMLNFYLKENKKRSDSRKISLPMKDIEKIFNKLSQGDNQKCIFFWQMLRTSDITLSSNCYEIILRHSPSNKYLTKHRKKIVKEMDELGYKLSVSTLKKLMNSYSQMGEMRYVKKWYQYYLKLGHDTSKDVYSYLIEGNTLVKNITAVNHFLKQMVKSSLKPTKKQIDEFIKLCAIANINDSFDHIKWAFEKYYLRSSGYKPTMEIYDMVFLSCSKRRQRAYAKRYFKELIENTNLKPTALTFEYLIFTQIGPIGDGFPGFREDFAEILKEATDLYKLMRQEYLLRPNMLTCYTLMKSLVGHGDKASPECMKVLPELSYELLVKLQFNVNPKIMNKIDRKFLQQLFSTLLKYNYPDEARNVYKIIRMRGYDSAIENCLLGLIESYSNRGDHNTALQLFHEMISKGVRPQQYHYNLLLKGYFQKNDIEGGMKFFDSIKLQYHLIPSKDVYETVIQALIDVGDIQRARRVYQKSTKHYETLNSDKFNKLFGDNDRKRSQGYI